MLETETDNIKAIRFWFDKKLRSGNKDINITYIWFGCIPGSNPAKLPIITPKKQNSIISNINLKKYQNKIIKNWLIFPRLIPWLF